MKNCFWNPFSIVVTCGMLLTFGVGNVSALMGTAIGLMLAWHWFGRIGRS